MWPIGHAAVGYICYSLLSRWQTGTVPLGRPVGVLLLGTQTPDLVDKSLAWFLGVLPAGRSLGHSLVVLVPACVCVVLVAARYGRRDLGAAFALGALTHPLVDAVPVLWEPGGTGRFLLWPLLSVETVVGAPSLVELFRSSLTDPWFHLEFVLLAIALVAWRRDRHLS